MARFCSLNLQSDYLGEKILFGREMLKGHYFPKAIIFLLLKCKMIRNNITFTITNIV